MNTWVNTERSFAMHNCRETKEQITEFVLDGADRRPGEVLLAELRVCAECRAEFNALNATLRVTTRLRETAAPSETYWSGYHAKLRHKLVNTNAQSNHSSGTSWFARFFKASISVPAPVAAALIVACAVLIPIAIRAARQQQPQTPAIVHVPVATPVVQEKPTILEKVVTRVVYRDRRSPGRTSKRVVDPSKIESTFAKSQKPQNAEILPTLTGFKPTEEVKLTIIKGGSQNEK
jgi:hypothetical protein